MSELLLRLVSKYDGFYEKPPLDYNKFIYKKYSKEEYELVAFCNDGGEVWIGNQDTWYTYMKHNEFLKICLWYLFQRAIIDVCGIRTFIYYKLLAHKIKRGYK